jgi:hypothetical protein
MKQILLMILLIFIPITNIVSQENKSRFGIEVDITPLHFDTFSRQKSPFSISGFIGGSYEHFFSNSFSFKTTVGVQNVTYKYGAYYLDEEKERHWQTSLVLKAEPRFYFLGNQQKWGNLFASLPISIGTGTFQNNPYKNIFDTQHIKAFSVIGYQYYVTNHWFIEANAGLGWSQDRYPTQSFNDFDYLIGARFGFSF